MEGEQTGKTNLSPETWAGLLAAYRRGPRERWSGELLARLGPWLGAALHDLWAAPPYLSWDDVVQALTMEVLGIAGRWQPTCEDQWIPRRLVERAARKVTRSLLREAANQGEELTEVLEANQSAEPDLVFDTPIGEATARDLRVIYRSRVLGEPVEAMADELGLSVPRTVRLVAKALKRARANKGSRV